MSTNDISPLELSSDDQGRVFVGRQREIALLLGGLSEASSGRGRLFLVGGEPGIGKTRLADAFAQEAKSRDALTMWGRCWEEGGAPAYWPWIQSLRGLLTELDPETLHMAAAGQGGVLAQMLPELRDYLPDLPEPPSLSPEAARFRLFDALVGFLVRISQHRMLVFVLEDLHAADDPSLLLLQFLAGQLANGKILLLGTYRDVEVSRDHPLAPVLAELSRSQATTRIDLAGLSEPDVARFIMSMEGQTPSEELVSSISRETEGNPLFIEEVVRLLVSEGRLWTYAGDERIPIPEGVREVIGRRLGGLPADCHRILTIGAVIGREFSIEVMQRITGRTAAELLETLREAVSAKLIANTHEEPGRFRFAHALIRETLYEDLMPADRVRLHREVGQVLEATYAPNPEPHIEELAYHFYEAATGGDVRKAVEYAMSAGKRATDLLAFEEAVRLLNMALRVLRDHPDELQRCEALLRLGEAQARSGATPIAKETFLQAAEIATRMDQPEMLARAAIGYAGRFSFARAATDRQVIPLLRQALDALGVEDSLLRATLLGRLAGALRDQPSLEPRASLAREAVEMARRIGDPATLFYALVAEWAASLLGPDGVDQQIIVAEELNALAEKVQDRERIADVGWVRFIRFMTRGQIWEARAQQEVMARAAHELGQPSQLWYAGVIETVLTLSDGGFDDAEKLIRQTMDYGRRAQAWDAEASRLFALFVLRREQGRLNELEEDIRRALVTHPGYRSLRVMLLIVLLDTGRGEEARVLFDQLAEDDFAMFPKDNEWLFATTLLAEAANILDDDDRALVLYEQLRPYEDLVALAASEVSVGPVALALGILAAQLGHHEEAAAYFETALGLSLQMQARPWVAHTYHSYATLLAARNQPGDRDKAVEQMMAALGISEELGMPSLTERLQLRLAELGAKPRRRTPDGRRNKEAPKGSVLTPREREVAALVAEGMTNRQIGESLYVSERTAETHVENILMKLGFTSRTQVARWVLDSGLHGEDT